MMNEIKELRRLLDGYEKQMTGQSGEFYHAHAIVEKLRSFMSFGRLLELVEAEKKGLNVMLPCKVGDMVYDKESEPFIVYCVSAIARDTAPDVHIRIHATPKNGCSVSDDMDVWNDDFGKTVFLTPEAALAAQEGAE